MQFANILISVRFLKKNYFQHWIPSKAIPLIIMLITKVSSTNYENTPPHTFGHAHLFSPWPNTVVGAHCKWEVILNTVYNRIPRTITEIVCQTPNVTCGGNTNYQVILILQKQ